MAVARVLAEADVGDEHELRVRGVERAERALDDAVVVPRAGRLLVLLLRDAEKQKGLDAERDELTGLAHELVDGELRDRVEPLDGPHDALPRAREERHDEVVEVEPRLAHERPQRVGAPQPPEPRCGKGAHG